MAPAMSEDREIIQLAIIQFGETTRRFEHVTFLHELVSELVRFADEHPDRAIEVRQFMDLHELHHWDRKKRLPEILRRQSVLRESDRDFADDELNDWTKTKRDERQLSRPARGTSSFWAWLRNKLFW